MAEEEDKFRFEKNFSKKSSCGKNGQYNHGLVPNGREYDWQIGPGPGGSWVKPWLYIQALEASVEYKKLAAEVTLYAQSVDAFLTEYTKAYAAMDRFLDIFWQTNNLVRPAGPGLTVYGITTGGTLA